MFLKKSNNPNDIIHVDTCGPSTITSLHGKKYYLLFADDYLCFQWIYILQNKNQSVETFKHFEAFVFRKFNCIDKALHSNGGTEFQDLEYFLFQQKQTYFLCQYTLTIWCCQA